MTFRNDKNNPYNVNQPYSAPSDYGYFQYGSRPATTGSTGVASTPPQRTRGGPKVGLAYGFAYLAVIWTVHIINVVFFNGRLIVFGIHPLDVSSLWGIITSPLLHADFSHLISNSVPGFVFAFLIGYSGHRVFWEVTIITGIVGGFGTWLFGGIGTNHIGASGLVYGWLAYLLVRGIFNRSLWQILLGVVLGMAYSGLIWGVLPGTPGVSWQAHLFGAIGGVLAGMIITSDDPPHLTERRRQRQAQKQQGRAQSR